MADFSLKIISPRRVEYEGDVESLIVPGEGGYIGILAHHAPILASLADGALTLRRHAEDPQVMQITGGGFVEVNRNKVLVLVNKIE